MRKRRALAERALAHDLGGVTLDPIASSTHAPLRLFEATCCIGSGQPCWDAAVRAVMSWEVKTRSGFRIFAESGGEVAAVERERVWFVAHVGPLRVHEPVEVVRLLDEPNRRGYAYEIGRASGRERGESW